MSTIDTVYPYSPSIASRSTGWQKFVTKQLQDSIKEAARGDRQAEEMIVLRVGQLRRSMQSFTALTKELIEAVRSAIQLLKAHGRHINLNNQDPRYWISNVDGSSIF